MSSTNNSTQYAFSINVEVSGVTGFMNLTAAQSTDFQDADALALFTALIAAFPAAWNAGNSSSIQKSTLNDTYYTGDVSADPPAFQ